MTRRERELRSEFGPLGCAVSKTRGNHYRVILPDGRSIFTPSTPSDYRSDRNLRAQVRRALTATPCHIVRETE